MAKISIVNLEFQCHKSSLIFLETEELVLIKTALKRAVDTRKIVGGLSSNFEIETRGGISID